MTRDDYRRAVAELEANGLVAVDRSDPDHWEVRPTTAGMEIAQRIITLGPVESCRLAAIGRAMRLAREEGTVH